MSGLGEVRAGFLEAKNGLSLSWRSDSPIMENASLTCLMRARDTLDVCSRSLALISADLDRDALFGAGLMCADLLALIDDLFAEFEIIFPEEIAAIGPVPVPPPDNFDAEVMLGEVTDYFLDCRDYLGEIGRQVEVDTEQTEITDQDLWDFTADQSSS
jgi:hypothetical protein